MGESLTERHRVWDEVLRDVNHCWRGRQLTVPSEKAPANYVPAAAVIRRGQALSRFTPRNPPPPAPPRAPRNLPPPPPHPPPNPPPSPPAPPRPPPPAPPHPPPPPPPTPPHARLPA